MGTHCIESTYVRSIAVATSTVTSFKSCQLPVGRLIDSLHTWRALRQALNT